MTTLLHADDQQPAMPKQPAAPNQLSTIEVTRFVRQINRDKALLSQDRVIVEEPLQISLRYVENPGQAAQSKALTVTMRTPGNDVALACGFLFTEGIIGDCCDIIAFNQHGVSADNDGEHRGSDSDDNADDNTANDEFNHLELTMSPALKLDWSQLQRYFTRHSSCGICGKSSLASLALKTDAIIDETPGWLSDATVVALPALLLQQQRLFHLTGGVHGAGYFANNTLLLVAEDVGRHNALDKVIGEMLLQNLWQAQSVLILSGRISFELIQKAVMANIPVIIAVGAPSSLAIAAARQFNITLIGFTKTQQFNVYHGDWRLQDKRTIDDL